MSSTTRLFRHILIRWIAPGIPVILIGCAILLWLSMPAPPAEAESDVADRWNMTLSRLGIVPIYPPLEDFHVGDLWAFATSDAQDGPLLRNAVRLTHIDLREDIGRQRNGQPVFPDTVASKSGEQVRQSNEEVTGGQRTDLITLSLASFPGVAIHRARKTSGSFQTRLFGLGAAQDDSRDEEIRIPVAETYGVDPAAALARLSTWCKQPDTRLYCSDAFARRVFAFSVNNDIVTKRDGKFIFRLQLCLVTRVYLTREIEFHTLHSGSTRIEANGEAPSAAGMKGEAELGQQQGSDLVLRQEFRRPLAFGFRSVNIALKSASP